MPQTILIRPAAIIDASAVNDHIREVYREVGHLITREEEFRMGSWRQRYWIAKKLTSRLETCLVAVADGKIVGILDSWTDARHRVRHSTTFAMSIKNGWRGKGVGKKLLLHFIDWVQNHTILERIELHVHNDNARAINLYQSLGFRREGTRLGVVRYEDGRTVDDYIMALWPGDDARANLKGEEKDDGKA